MNILHVIPVDDIKEHTKETIERLGLVLSLCPCQPKDLGEYGSDDIIFVHGAFDGREALEEVKEILNQSKND